MEAFDIFTVSEKIGFPALVIFFLCFGIYKVARWFGTKLDPIFEQLSSLIKDHKELIKDLQVHLKTNDEFVYNQMKLTDRHLADLSEKMSIITELAQERNAYMKDTTSVYKYMNAEIGPKSSINDLYND